MLMLYEYCNILIFVHCTSRHSLWIVKYVIIVIIAIVGIVELLLLTGRVEEIDFRIEMNYGLSIESSRWQSLFQFISWWGSSGVNAFFSFSFSGNFQEFRKMINLKQINDYAKLPVVLATALRSAIKLIAGDKSGDCQIVWEMPMTVSATATRPTHLNWSKKRKTKLLKSTKLREWQSPWKGIFLRRQS